MASVSEYSPLLRHRTHESYMNSAPEPPTTISAVLRRARSGDARLLYIEDLVPTSLLNDADDNVSERFSFALIVLLKLREIRLTSTNSLDIWEHWSEHTSAPDDLKALEDRIELIWEQFLAEYRSYEQLEQVLWIQWPLDDHTDTNLSVVDLLRDKDAPSTLLSNSAVLRSLQSYWWHGAYLRHNLDESLGARLLRLWDTSTPAVTHLLSFASLLAYLVVLAHYILLPPTAVSEPIATNTSHTPDPRAIVLIILSFTNGLQSSWLSLPFFVVFLSFLVTLPSVPYDTSLAFDFLLAAFFVHFIALHLPRYPSPIFFAPPEASLPLSIFLSRGLTHVMFPVLTFFLPAIIFAGLLLSLALKDFSSFTTYDLDSPVLAPMKTRDMFLLLGGFTVLCFICALVLVGSSTAAQHRDRQNWDRFSDSVGLEARRLTIGATVHYGAAYTFPAPFNLIQVIYQLLTWAFGYHPAFFYVKLALWRVLVGPINAITNILIWVVSREGLVRTIGL